RISTILALSALPSDSLAPSPVPARRQPSPPLLAFFSNDPATTEIYTLSLHDALPIFLDLKPVPACSLESLDWVRVQQETTSYAADRKSTRLNSSHQIISYAVFCLKKKIQVHNARRHVAKQGGAADEAAKGISINAPTH